MDASSIFKLFNCSMIDGVIVKKSFNQVQTVQTSENAATQCGHALVLAGPTRLSKNPRNARFSCAAGRSPMETMDSP
eukprot:4555459-Pyramimonas_sp.AAC.1